MQNQKEIPINEFVTIGNEIYKCVESDDCSICDFTYSNHCNDALCSERTDGRLVGFILYDDTSEDN